MKKMFDWIITVGTSVLDTKKELLAKLYKTQNINIPLERYVICFIYLFILCHPIYKKYLQIKLGVVCVRKKVMH